MGKKNCCPPPTGGIPLWFVTYSDVITLLMTFFILLLTFATTEPESESPIQIVTFGGGGATGVAGKSSEGMDKDNIVLRERPNSAVIGPRGSETPPSHSDPAIESVSRGLQSLQNPDVLADASRVRIETNISIMRDDKGEITEQGVTQLRMLANQLKTQPLSLQILVSDPEQAAFCIRMAAILTDGQGLGVVPGKVPGRVAVGVTDPTMVPSGRIVYQLSRTEKNR